MNEGSLGKGNDDEMMPSMRTSLCFTEESVFAFTCYLWWKSYCMLCDGSVNLIKHWTITSVLCLWDPLVALRYGCVEIISGCVFHTFSNNVIIPIITIILVTSIIQHYPSVHIYYALFSPEIAKLYEIMWYEIREQSNPNIHYVHLYHQDNHFQTMLLTLNYHKLSNTVKYSATKVLFTVQRCGRTVLLCSSWRRLHFLGTTLPLYSQIAHDSKQVLIKLTKSQIVSQIFYLCVCVCCPAMCFRHVSKDGTLITKLFCSLNNALQSHVIKQTTPTLVRQYVLSILRACFFGGEKKVHGRVR